MMRKLCVLLVFLMSTMLRGQNNCLSDLDTVHLYDRNKKEYCFLMAGKPSGFDWGTIEGLSDSLRFKIVNNTGQQLVIKRVGGGDGSILFYASVNNNHFHIRPRDRVILDIDSFFYVYPKTNYRKGTFRKALQISYSIIGDDSLRTLIIPTWGNLSYPTIKTSSAKSFEKQTPYRIKKYNKWVPLTICPQDSSEFGIHFYESREAKYNGGMLALTAHIDSCFKQSEITVEKGKARVYVSFNVNADASLSDFEILKSSVSSDLDKQLCDILYSTSLSWQPAICCPPDWSWQEPTPKNQNPVPCCYCQKRITMVYQFK